VVVPLRDGQPAAASLIAEFARRYGNAETRVQYVAELTDLFQRSRRDHPRLLTEADVLHPRRSVRRAHRLVPRRTPSFCGF
jgi:hypothetical protein